MGGITKYYTNSPNVPSKSETLNHKRKPRRKPIWFALSVYDVPSMIHLGWTVTVTKRKSKVVDLVDRSDHLGPFGQEQEQ